VVVNINLDGFSILTILPGIGPSRAEAILEFRQRNGFYHTPEDLIKVPGIGPGVVNRIRPFVSLESPDPIKKPGRSPDVSKEQIQ